MTCNSVPYTREKSKLERPLGRIKVKARPKEEENIIVLKKSKNTLAEIDKGFQPHSQGFFPNQEKSPGNEVVAGLPPVVNSLEPIYTPG